LGSSTDNAAGAGIFVPLADHIHVPKGWRGVVPIQAGVAGLVAFIAAAFRVALGYQSASFLAVGIAVAALIVAFALVYVQLRKRNVGIFFRNGRIGVADAFGRPTGMDLSQADHLQLCTLAARNFRPIRLLLVIERNGRVGLRFYGADALEPGGVERLAERAHVPIHGSWEEAYRPADLEKRFPAALPLGQRISYAIVENPTRTTWIVAGATILAFVVLTIVLLSRSST
jgi:hypothetical protein